MIIINLKYAGDPVVAVCATSIIGTKLDFNSRNRLTIFTSGGPIETNVPFTLSKFQEFNKIWQEAQLIPLVSYIDFDPFDKSKRSDENEDGTSN